MVEENYTRDCDSATIPPSYKKISENVKNTKKCLSWNDHKWMQQELKPESLSS